MMEVIILKRDNVRKYKRTIIAMVKEGYDCKVALEALSRAGKCMQLKGHIHEILFKDQYNSNIKNILDGKYANLTKSNTAQMKDIIMMKGGKIIGHAQLKDTISSTGISKTIKQIKAGKYNKTSIYGTKETVNKISDKVTQKVNSSGISTETTSRIARKALGKMPSMEMLKSSAKSGGITGAVLGAGIETLNSTIDVCKGRKTVKKAVADVAVAGAKGGVIGAVCSVTSAWVAGAVGSVCAVSVAPVILGTVAACAVGHLANNVVESENLARLLN